MWRADWNTRRSAFSRRPWKRGTPTPWRRPPAPRRSPGPALDLRRSSAGPPVVLASPASLPPFRALFPLLLLRLGLGLDDVSSRSESGRGAVRDLLRRLTRNAVALVGGFAWRRRR